MSFSLVAGSSLATARVGGAFPHVNAGIGGGIKVVRPVPMMNERGGVRPEREADHRMARVLVIDDEPDVLLLCRVNLERAGHEVLEAPDGERGMALARTERPDVIVLDVMLPRTDGFEILETFLALDETRNVPIVMLTAKTQHEDQVRGWSAGASGYVTKPFSPAALTETLARVHAMTQQERRQRRADALAILEDRTFEA
jgi:DNA-binding response OmpR family regulator